LKLKLKSIKSPEYNNDATSLGKKIPISMNTRKWSKKEKNWEKTGKKQSNKPCLLQSSKLAALTGEKKNFACHVE